MSSFHSEAGANIKHIFSGQYTLQNPWAFSINYNAERGWNGRNWPGKELALSSVNRGVALDSSCMFEAMFLKNIGDSGTFFRANWTYKNKMLNGERVFMFKT